MFSQKTKNRFRSQPLWCRPGKKQPHIHSGRANKLLLKVTVCYSEPCRTFTVGIIVSQWAEAILTNTAVSCLQVHTVGVLHAAVALWAEVMTCGRHREEKVETQRSGEERSDGGIQGQWKGYVIVSQPFLWAAILWLLYKAHSDNVTLICHFVTSGFINYK